VSFLLISFFPRFRRVAPIPSLAPISTAVASSSSSHHLSFLFLVSFFVCRVFLSRFLFAFDSPPNGPTAPIALCPAEGIVSPLLRASFRGKVRGPPQGRPRSSQTRKRSSSRCSRESCAVSSAFLHLARAGVFSFMFCMSSSLTSVTNIYFASCLNVSISLNPHEIDWLLTKLFASRTLTSLHILREFNLSILFKRVYGIYSLSNIAKT